MMSDNRNTASFYSKSLPWLMCMVGMMFYCYNYFLRSSPSIMQNDLMQTLNISATQFGTLILFYYAAYTPMQIPVGMIYDKFGARFVLFLACLTAVFGLAIFAGANTFGVACAGRFLIGLGTAFSYIGVLKLASVWLPPSRFATAAGLTTAFGMTSGALAQKYLAKVIEVVGYKPILHTALLIGIVLSFAIPFFVRSRPKQLVNSKTTMQTPMTTAQLFGTLKAIFTNPQMWLIGIIGCVLYLPSIVLLDVYGISYFKAAHQLTSQQAANVSALTLFGWIVGGPVIGIISDKIKRRRLPLIITSAITAMLLYAIFYYPELSMSQLSVIAFIAGFCCGAHPLCFALGKENNPVSMAGTAVAVTNMFIMMGGIIFPPIVGKLLDLHTNVSANGLHTYLASDYTFALSVVPMGIVLGTILSMFLKETYCESHETSLEKKSAGKFQNLQTASESAR
jgi:MFS family permease